MQQTVYANPAAPYGGYGQRRTGRTNPLRLMAGGIAAVGLLLMFIGLFVPYCVFSMRKMAEIEQAMGRGSSSSAAYMNQKLSASLMGASTFPGVVCIILLILALAVLIVHVFIRDLGVPGRLIPACALVFVVFAMLLARSNAPFAIAMKEAMSGSARNRTPEAVYMATETIRLFRSNGAGFYLLTIGFLMASLALILMPGSNASQKTGAGKKQGAGFSAAGTALGSLLVIIGVFLSYRIFDEDTVLAINDYDPRYDSRMFYSGTNLSPTLMQIGMAFGIITLIVCGVCLVLAILNLLSGKLRMVACVVSALCVIWGIVVTFVARNMAPSVVMASEEAARANEALSLGITDMQAAQAFGLGKALTLEQTMTLSTFLRNGMQNGTGFWLINFGMLVLLLSMTALLVRRKSPAGRAQA